jgi:flagellar basal body rod protein FlgF
VAKPSVAQKSGFKSLGASRHVTQALHQSVKANNLSNISAQPGLHQLVREIQAYAKDFACKLLNFHSTNGQKFAEITAFVAFSTATGVYTQSLLLVK